MATSYKIEEVKRLDHLPLASAVFRFLLREDPSANRPRLMGDGRGATSAA